MFRSLKIVACVSSAGLFSYLLYVYYRRQTTNESASHSNKEVRRQGKMTRCSFLTLCRVACASHLVCIDVTGLKVF